MSKAKDLAEKAYPQGDIYIFGDASIACQVAYVKGYYQAEKDWELTWNDVALILNTAEEFNRKNTVPISDEEYFKEVLNRFKDYKK